MASKGSDPLLETFQLGPVRLKNKIFSSGHALSHAQAGRPTDTTLCYQMEKAEGGIGLSAYSRTVWRCFIQSWKADV